MTTYTKLRSGEWGIRVEGSANVGDTVTVTTKAGATKTERIAKVIWQGNGVTLAAIARNNTAQSQANTRDRECPGRGPNHSCPSWATHCWYYDEEV